MCVDAFIDVPYRVVVSSGGKDVELGKLPQNILFKEFVPQIEVLQYSDAFVTHGGWNSINESLYQDVPMLVCPQGKDQFMNAGIINQLGTGITLIQATPESLRSSVDRLLADTKVRDKASSIGATLRATGGASSAASEILAVMNL